MQVLYVHGMGRSPVSGWPLLRRLRRAGLRTYTFGHFVSRETFAAIVGRLAKQLTQMASAGDYVLVGHSLGGVLLRQALRTLPDTVRKPKRLFLLGSPIQVSSVAVRMGSNPLYRLLTGDCGMMLGSRERMAAVATPGVPVTAVVGVKGWSLVAGLLPEETHDGIVTVAETSAPWLTDVVQLPVTHMLLPTDSRVTEVILERLRA
jgi:pimeloyl-ACP methyl ester carboxylesterase